MNVVCLFAYRLVAQCLWPLHLSVEVVFAVSAPHKVLVVYLLALTVCDCFAHMSEVLGWLMPVAPALASYKWFEHCNRLVPIPRT